MIFYKDNRNSALLQNLGDQISRLEQRLAKRIEKEKYDLAKGNSLYKGQEIAKLGEFKLHRFKISLSKSFGKAMAERNLEKGKPGYLASQLKEISICFYNKADKKL